MSAPRLHEYRVGALYHPDRTRYDEISQYNYWAGGHELLIFVASPTRSEMQAMQKGPWEFGLMVRPEVLFLLYKPGSMPWSDAPYSWWRVKERLPEEALPPFELPTPASRALLTLIVIDADTGIIRLLKAITFSPGFSRALHAAIRGQIGRGERAPGEYERAVDRYYRIYPLSEQMLPAASARCRGGED